jgi:hypothetical protein
MTTAIVAIVVVAALILLAVMLVMPRAKAKARERELEQRRDEVAGAHREHADQRVAKAEVAEHHAARERAEAELHEARARLHERGLADDELDTERERLTDAGDARTGGDRSTTEHRDDPAGADERLAAERDATVPPEERRR